MVVSAFNQQTDILESKFEGDLKIKDVLAYIESIKNNKTYPRNLKIITDTTQAHFNLSISDIRIIAIENDKTLEEYNSITEAIIVNEPNSTALSMFYKGLERNKKFKFDLFSTKEAALKWINQIKILGNLYRS